MGEIKKESFNKYEDIFFVGEIKGVEEFKLIDSMNNFSGSLGSGMGRSFTNEICKPIKSGIKKM